MHDQPRPSEREQEEDTPDRHDEEDAMRGPGHENPRETIDPDPGSGDSGDD